MKKALRSALCLLVVLVMLGGTAECFAACRDYSGYTTYVSLGDSIADGIGLPANPLRGPDQPDKTLVYGNKTEGAYPVLLAKALGISDECFTQLGCAGMRTVELRALLDPGYQIPDNLANNFMGDELTVWVKNRFPVVQLVSDADIITMNMCANDIAAYALFCLRDELNSQGVAGETIDRMVGKLEACGDYTGALVKLLRYSETLDGYSRAINAAINGLNTGYTRWTKNWDAIVKRIYELNPDVTLICVGMYNPFNRLKLTGKSLVRIGAVADGLIAAINAWSRSGSAYAKKYTYVDIMGIESMCAEKGLTLTDSSFTGSMELNVHPSAKGHRQIADKVLAKVPERSAGSVPATPVKKESVTKTAVKQAKKAVNAVTKPVKIVVKTVTRPVVKVVSSVGKVLKAQAK